MKNHDEVKDFMEKNKEKKKISFIIDQISEIRKNNNEKWMQVLRIAFDKSPEQAKEIFKQITENDKKINELSKELCE